MIRRSRSSFGGFAAQRVSQILKTAMFGSRRNINRSRRGEVKIESYETRALLSAIVVTSLADNITSDGKVTLREAVTAANTDTSVDGSSPGNGADIIRFAPGLTGTISMSLGQIEISSSLTINGHGAASTIIDARQLSRIFDITFFDGDVTLSKMTLKNGRVSGDADEFLNNDFSGGAIRALSNGKLTISESLITGSSANGRLGRGGAIFSTSTDVEVLQSTISGNSTVGSEGEGGGIYAFYGDVSIGESLVTGNSTAGTGARGGAVNTLNGTVNVSQSTLSNNSTTGDQASGGAIHSTFGVIAVTESTLTANSTIGTGALGGAINLPNGLLRLNWSTVSGNTTSGINSFGGGIASYNSGSMHIANSTLSGNKALGSGEILGGALYFDDGDVTITNSTITGNSAPIGGGIGILDDDFGESLTIHNSIVAGNTATTNPDFTAPGVPETNLTVLNSLIGNNTGTSLTIDTDGDANGNFIGGIGANAINPLLGPLQNNGGFTFTHALLPGSPALNRGNNSLAEVPGDDGLPGTDDNNEVALTTDQRSSGFGRIRFGTIDIGAFESTTLDGTTGSDTFVLTYSSTSNAGNVSISVSSNGGPFVSKGTFPMSTPLTINGLGGSDSVRVVGTTSADTFSVNAGTTLTVNGASLTLTSIETRTLAGAAGGDLYKFDADSALGLWTLDEAGGGMDTVDLSPTTTVGLVLNLATAGTQTVHATNLSLVLNSALTFENAVGGSVADTLIGNSLANTLVGGAGDDRLLGAAGSDLLLGGANNDTYTFLPASSAEADQVTESSNSGIDTLNFAFLTSSVMLNLGSTSVQAVHANRTLKLNSSAVFEDIISGSGADTLFGNTLNNSLTGGAGDDKLTGGAGSDVLLGGANNDTYMFSAASVAEADQVTENTNSGVDTLNFAFLTTNVVLNLGSTSIQSVHSNRTLKLNSLSAFENAVGGTGSDTLLGNTLANRLTGGDGNNILVGMESGDILEAGSGRDILIGGLGLDILNGGTGDDVLIAGRTTSDTSLNNLNTLRTQWISANAYTIRIANLRAGVGSPVVSLKAKINVLNDAGENDVMTGGGNSDWFFRAVDDVITDLFAGELFDVL